MYVLSQLLLIPFQFLEEYNDVLFRYHKIWTFSRQTSLLISVANSGIIEIACSFNNLLEGFTGLTQDCVLLQQKDSDYNQPKEKGHRTGPGESCKQGAFSYSLLVKLYGLCLLISVTMCDDTQYCKPGEFTPASASKVLLGPSHVDMLDHQCV